MISEVVLGIIKNENYFPSTLYGNSVWFVHPVDRFIFCRSQEYGSSSSFSFLFRLINKGETDVSAL